MIVLNDRSLYEEEYQHLLDIAQKDDIPLNQYLRQPQIITTCTTNTASSTILEEDNSTHEQNLSNVVTDDTSTMDTTTGDRCCICLTNTSSVILFSCGHKCLCDDCADQQEEQLTRCPLCRQDVMHSQ
jgi:hypothetical protein